MAEEPKLPPTKTQDYYSRTQSFASPKLNQLQNNDNNFFNMNNKDNTLSNTHKTISKSNSDNIINTHLNTKTLTPQHEHPSLSLSSILTLFITDFELNFSFNSLNPAIKKLLKILKDNYMDKITICEKYKEKTDNIESTFHNQDEEDLVDNIEVIEELLKDGILLEKENELLERQNLLRKETKDLITDLKQETKVQVTEGRFGSAAGKLWDLIKDIIRINH